MWRPLHLQLHLLPLTPLLSEPWRTRLQVLSTLPLLLRRRWQRPSLSQRRRPRLHRQEQTALLLQQLLLVVPLRRLP